MKTMYKFLYSTLFCLFIATTATANDGYYLMHGDQLIPLQQNDISVQKEVLNITQIKHGEFLVDVHYTFYNPGEEQTLLVGFEARAPQNYYFIFDEAPKKEKTHPFLENFSVVLNGVNLPYKTAVVTDKIDPNIPQPKTTNRDWIIKSRLKASNGKVLGISQKQIAKLDYKTGKNFSYAYYFNAKFKPGKNILRHQYRFSYGATSHYKYELGYLLTPANRWANKQIDNFTLNLSFNNPSILYINTGFFKDKSNWSSDGKLYASHKNGSPINFMQFYTDGKRLTFHKKNFHPEGELYFYSMNYEMYYQGLCFGEDNLLPYNKKLFQTCKNPDVFERKVLRNLPFAKRGYIFHDKEVLQYYKKTQKWYQPNPSYQPEPDTLSALEKEWTNHWR